MLRFNLKFFLVMQVFKIQSLYQPKPLPLQ